MVSSPDPFDILDLPPRFDLVNSEIEASFEKALALLHPDRWQGDLLRSQAHEMSARVTEAYRLISHPITRAEALLKRRGPDFWPVAADPEVLEAIMTWQEAPPSEGETSLSCKWTWAEQRLIDGLSKNNPQACAEGLWWLRALASAARAG